MKRIISRCASLTVFCLCAALITLALLLGALRLAAPYADQYKDFISAQLSAVAGQPLSVVRMRVELDGWNPRIRLDGLKILDKASKESLLEVEQAYVALDINRSLRERQIRFEDIVIVGSHLRVVRDHDGALRVYGLGGLSRPGDGESVLTDALRDIRLNLLSSQVRFEDPSLDLDYTFRDVSIVFVSGGDEHKLYVKTGLPDTVGQGLTLVAKIRGQLDRPAGWSGKVYARLDRARVASVAGIALLRETGIERGVVSMETWSDWRDSNMVRLAGTFQVSEAGMQKVAYRGGASVGWQIPDQVRGRMLWRQNDSGWRLDIDDLQASGLTDNGPDAKVTLEMDYHAGNQRVVRGTLNHARLEKLLSLAVDKEQLDDELSEWLRHATPSAALSDVRFMAALEGDRVAYYGGSGEVKDLRFEPFKKVPGVSGLDGVFSLDDAGGELSLDSDDLQFTYPTWFAHELFVDRLRSQVWWKRSGSEVSLSAEIAELRNSDLQADGTVRLEFGKDSPYLDLKLDYRDIQVGNAVRYYPEKIMVPRVHRWLTRSIKAGYVPSGQLLFQGDVSRFPFKDGSGLFEARFDVEKGILDYRKGWPRAEDGSAELVFRNNSLSARVKRARILGSEINKATVGIKDFKRAELLISGQSAGPLTDLVAYLDQTALISKRSMVRELSLGGGGKLALDISVPLSKKLKSKRPRVSGRLSFDGATLGIPVLELSFNEIRGDVEFGPEGGRGQGIRARLAGNPVEASAERAGKGATRLKLSGRVETPELLRALKHPIFSRIGGSALLSAQIGLPAYRRNSREHVSVSLESDLLGARVDWPTPIGKTAEQRRPFTLTTTIDGENQYEIAYGEHAAVIDLAPGRTIQRAEFRLADGAAVMPEEGIRVRGRVDVLAVEEWLPWLGLLRAGQDGAEPDPGRAGELAAIDLSVGRLQWSGYSVDALDLSARREASNWMVDAASFDLQGSLTVPLAFDTGQPLVVELDHLRLEREPAVDRAGGAPLDPRGLPPIRFSSSLLRFNEFEFSDVSLAAEPLADGLEVKHLQVSAPLFQAKASGDWRMLDGDIPRSSFQAELSSANLEQTLNAWKISHTFRGAMARANVTLAWLDAPYRFTFHGLQGKANAVIEDGILQELEPGAGRLLGLFNLSALPRRLSFDFSDLFEKGLKFDRIAGNLEFVSSNVYTSDLAIKSTAADIVIRGRTGLEARDYDQFVTVTPQVSSGLPLAGAILGGPALGAAMFLADQLFDEVGDGINSAVRIKYRVTGSWDEPLVEVADTRGRNTSRAADIGGRK